MVAEMPWGLRLPPLSMSRLPAGAREGGRGLSNALDVLFQVFFALYIVVVLRQCGQSLVRWAGFRTKLRRPGKGRKTTRRASESTVSRRRISRVPITCRRCRRCC
jgi:hypothetical protein